jgi:Tol biopolymer transport system component
MNADGTEQRNLTRNAANESFWPLTSSWSPDGRKIVFGRGHLSLGYLPEPHSDENTCKWA